MTHRPTLPSTKFDQRGKILFYRKFLREKPAMGKRTSSVDRRTTSVASVGTRANPIGENDKALSHQAHRLVSIVMTAEIELNVERSCPFYF